MNEKIEMNKEVYEVYFKVMDNIKPCPFCGYKPELRITNMETSDSKYKMYDLHCKVCGCTLDFTRNNTLYWSEEQALENVINKWNDRERE